MIVLSSLKMFYHHLRIYKNSFAFSKDMIVCCNLKRKWFNLKLHQKILQLPINHDEKFIQLVNIFISLVTGVLFDFRICWLYPLQKGEGDTPHRCCPKEYSKFDTKLHLMVGLQFRDLLENYLNLIGPCAKKTLLNNYTKNVNMNIQWMQSP